MSENDYSELVEQLLSNSYALPSYRDKWIEIDGVSYPKNVCTDAAEAITALQRQLAEANELLRRVSELLAGRWALNSYGDCIYCGAPYKTGHNCELAQIETAIDAALTEGGE